MALNKNEKRQLAEILKTIKPTNPELHDHLGLSSPPIHDGDFFFKVRPTSQWAEACRQARRKENLNGNKDHG